MKLLAAILSLLFALPVVAQMQIENSIIRAMPAGQKVTAAYMKLSNSTDENRTLVGVTGEIGSPIEIHQSKAEEGVMKMRRLEGVEIPAHGMAVLSAQGLHLMIFNLQHDLVEGESHGLVLTYDDGSTQAVAAVVTSMLPAHDEAGHDHSTLHQATPSKVETHSQSE